VEELEAVSRLCPQLVELRGVSVGVLDERYRGEKHLQVRRSSMLWIRIRSQIRIRSDPKLFAESGSGINLFRPGSGQPLFGMNLKQNFSDKIHNFSTSTYVYVSLYDTILIE
jgi:hypothetical protein